MLKAIDILLVIIVCIILFIYQILTRAYNLSKLYLPLHQNSKKQ